MAVRIALFAILTVALILGSLYVIPTAVGYEIDCGTLERTVCADAWQRVKEDFDRMNGVPPFIPITGVTVREATNESPMCGTWTVHRYGIFDMVAIYDCF
jgi:hypothetical protein